jgi:flagellar FliL protein
MANPNPEKPEAAAKPEASAGGGGIKAFLPLVLTLVIMPALAYALTTFVLLPKLKKGLGVEGVQAREGEHGEGGHGHGDEKPGAKDSGKPRTKVTLNKIIVNVSGSLGTRMLLASFTLAGNSSDFKVKIEEFNDQLRDVAASTLGSKTIADIEKPDARNTIRSELITQFNGVLGPNTVQEIYITEFAIQ